MSKLGNLVDSCGGRLTLESGVPVSTTDQSAKATLYYTPYRSDRIALYDGANWKFYQFAETSLSLAALSDATNYDIFMYDNAGTVTLEALAWTNATTRATALVMQNGIYCKTGALTRRYLGTIRTSAAGQCSDTAVKRFIWSYRNRVVRRCYKQDTTTHAYTTGAFRSWNNDAADRIEAILGVTEDPILLMITAALQGTGGQYVAICMDATNNFLDEAVVVSVANSAGTTVAIRATACMPYMPTIGYHYYQVTEYGGANGTCSNMTITANIIG